MSAITETGTSISHAVAGSHVQIIGYPISDFSRHIVQDLAREAALHVVYVTSAKRTMQDQARIFYDKHVVEGKKAQYKNPEVTNLVNHARDMRAQGRPGPLVKKYLLNGIEHVHGGPVSVSRHLGTSPFCDIFDIAHYSGPTTGSKRKNYMTAQQAQAFLSACRKRVGFPIVRLGHSQELGFKLQAEFLDEKCFHFEILQPLYDRLEQAPGRSYA